MTAYVAVIKTQDEGVNHYYILLTADGPMQGWSTQARALAYFTDGYNNGHRRSYEASMSAVVHWLMFQPSIIELADASVVRGWLPDPNKPESFSLWSVAGGIHGLRLDPKPGARLWDTGTKPALITEAANK